MGYLDEAAGKRRENYTEAAVTSLTMTVGTADNTIADVGASFNQTTLNNNFRDVGEKLNAILVELRKAGVINP
jgi:hypothetical protein